MGFNLKKLIQFSKKDFKQIGLTACLLTAAILFSESAFANETAIQLSVKNGLTWFKSLLTEWIGNLIAFGCILFGVWKSVDTTLVRPTVYGVGAAVLVKSAESFIF